ncbi:MAG: YfiR family protein [Bacteroidales bacterium]|nr:YfiR family protein [Bacteroidales bacterium]
MRIFVLGLFLCVNIVAYSQNERFKSLFVFNFTKYIEWPDNYREGDFVISVLGTSPMYAELQHNVKGKQAGNQTIEVIQVSNISGIKKCHILYVPAQQSSLLEAVGKYLSGKPTLIITEKRGLIAGGTDINLSQTGGKLQFELKPKQIEKKNLKLSKTLLNLGIVYDESTTRKVPELESVDDTNVPR